MKNLSKFLPAETLFLAKGVDDSIREYLKVTFMDLLLKQVLKTIEVSKQSNPRDKARVYKYVVIGKNFYTYQSKPHENVFLDVFFKTAAVQVLFRHMVKMGYQNAKSENNYESLLLKKLMEDGYYSKSFIQKIFGGYSMTSIGFDVQSNLKKEITLLEKQLPDLIVNDKAQAFLIFKTIGGNIFLLKGIDFELLYQIDKELMQEMNKEKGKGESDSGCWGCGWDSYDSDSNLFDSSCSGDSGCSSGDSGCSGCGGCGGD